MKKCILIIIILAIFLTGCTLNKVQNGSSDNENTNITSNFSTNDYIIEGTTKSNSFIIDNVLHRENGGDIHYTSYFPDDYNSNEAYAIYFALSGWEGLYFQGVGANMHEALPFEAQKYNSKMIVISPQLDDWGEKSANDTIFLVEYFFSHYNIDKSKVYISGLSGGGETLSLVLEKKPELFTSALYVSSQWDGKYEKLIQSKTPLYMVIGENDSYYGSAKTKNAYNDMYKLYQKAGLSKEEINEILVLDVKPHEFFTSRGYSDEHAGCNLFAYEKDIMNWVFNKVK